MKKLTAGRLGAHGALLVVCLIWGTGFVAMKLALREVPPSSLVFVRFLVAAASLGIFLPAVGGPMPRFSRREGLTLVMASLAGIVAYQLLVTEGLEHTTASTAGVLNTASAVFALILGKIILDEHLTKEKLIGIPIAIVGVVIVVLWGSGQSDLEFSNLLGPLMITGGMCGWALCSVLLKPLLANHSHVYVSGLNILIGAAIMLPLGLTVDPAAILSISWVTWGSIVYLGAVCTATGQFLYVYGLSKLDSSQVVAYLYLLPFINMVVAAAVLGEIITVYLFFGGVLVIAGIVIANRSPRRASAPHAPTIDTSAPLAR